MGTNHQRTLHRSPGAGGEGARRRARPLVAASCLLALVAALSPGTAAQARSGAPVDTFSATQLAAVDSAVLAADVGGTAWTVDEETNRVVLAVDDTVSRAEIARIERRAGALADAITIERTPGTLRRLINGGDAIYSSDVRCSLGFNVRRGDTYFLLTAGHCTKGAGTWYTNSSANTKIGPTVGSSFPTNDYGLVRYSNGSLSHRGVVDLYNGSNRDITSAANPRVGQSVQRSGSTTGLHSGEVTGLDYTVNYGGGDVVHGMIRTNICAQPGDSGGPLFSGGTALGITSGGSVLSLCLLGGTTYYQPVKEALNAYDVSVY